LTFFENFINNITLTQELEFFVRIVVASICGAFIGLERTKRFKEAGIRTHILVACASALMMVVSKYGFADLVSEGGAFLAGTDGADASRIAAQVICGISFLGAGVIFKHGSSVKGLTTAAGIWATAGIGIAIGAGMYLEGIFVTLLVMLSQFLMHKVTLGKDLIESVIINARVSDSERFRADLEDMLGDKRSSVTYLGVSKNSDGTTSFKINATLPRKKGISALVLSAEADENILDFSAAPQV